MEWEKILAKQVTHKQLISKMYKELLSLDSKIQITQLKKKQTKNLNRYFSKEDIEMANGNIRRYSSAHITNHQRNANHNKNDM